MSELYPQVLHVHVDRAEGLPIHSRAYIALDVVGKKAAEACPPPVTRTVETPLYGAAEWGESHSVLLRSGDTATLVMTIWARRPHNCDAILGRAVLRIDRLNPPGEKIAYLHSGRSLHITVDVRTTSLLLLQEGPKPKGRQSSSHAVPLPLPQAPSVPQTESTLSDTTSAATALTQATAPQSPRDVLVIDSASTAMQVLSRSVVSWLAEKLRDARRTVKAMRSALEYREMEGRAALHRIETLEGVVAVKGELATQEAQRWQEQVSELQDETRAAIQALEAKEAEFDEVQRINTALSKQYDQMKHALRKAHQETEAERARHPEGAAVEALLNGGSGEVISDLELRVQRLSAENQHLHLRLQSFCLMEGLVERFLPKLYKTLDLGPGGAGSGGGGVDGRKAAGAAAAAAASRGAVQPSSYLRLVEKEAVAAAAGGGGGSVPHPPGRGGVPAAARRPVSRRAVVSNEALQLVSATRAAMTDVWS